ncbi:MAG: sn-glycerol-3-phosphate ABC transporter ATP-binding protein UgpC [Melioribacteraceae bacterium]
MAEVKLVNVSKTYEGKNKAVDNITLQVNDKEFVVLVGPSGCGKTTTLRMVAGLEEISEGEIFIDGKLVNNVQSKDRDIAMVFQNYALYPHMTVFDNMAFGLKLRKFSKNEITERVNHAAKILDMEHLLDRKPKQLSGGQRQRVAVGRAIVRKPKVFLFDEPLSNLDAKLRVQMRAEISRLHQRLEATTIYVTHDQTEAMTMGDRIVVLKDGIVQQVDSPMNLYNYPTNKFVAGFIGSPAINFIDGKIVQENGLTFLSREKLISFQLSPNNSEKLIPFIGKDVTLGIRPEEFRIESNGGYKINVEVDLVEQLGSDVYLHFNLEGIPFIGRVKPTMDFRSRKEFKLYFDSEMIHLFDRAEGKKII